MSAARDAYLWRRFAEILADAHLSEVEPLSSRVLVDERGMTLSVETAARGRLEIGTITDAELEAGEAAVNAADLAAWHEHERDVTAWAFEPMRKLADELDETYRRKPLEKKAAKKQAKRARALELRASGRSVAYIARELGVVRRTVERYFAPKDSATDRERPG